MSEVAILMSTYNGERYLEEQIESILNQTYCDWTLYIRDDGSKDHTADIIRRFTQRSNKIVFINDNSARRNVGVCNSFMSLLKRTSARYYFFCDQDDVWLENKIEVSLRLLKENEPGPVCVFTDAEVVSKNLKPLQRMDADNVWTDFLQLAFTNCVTGCTMAFTQEVKRLINFENNFDNIYMHDWWIALLAAHFGKLVYYNQPTLLYRQHGNNVIGGNERNTVRHVFHRLNHMQKERENVKHSVDLLTEFYSQYGDSFTENEKCYLFAYATLRKQSSFSNNLKLVIQFPPRRRNFKGKLFFSYLLIAYPNDYRK